MGNCTVLSLGESSEARARKRLPAPAAATARIVFKPSAPGQGALAVSLIADRRILQDIGLRRRQGPRRCQNFCSGTTVETRLHGPALAGAAETGQ